MAPRTGPAKRLKDTAGRREPAAGDVGNLGPDPEWTLEVRGDRPSSRRVLETLFTLADGRFGTRGTPEEGGPGYEPSVMAAGVYRRSQGDVPRPLPGPLWFALDLEPGDGSRDRRMLDLRCGVLYREREHGPTLASERFACLHRPGTVAARVEVEGRWGPGEPLAAPGAAPDAVERGARDGVGWIRIHGIGGITGAVSTDHRRVGGRHRIERIAALRASPNDAPPPDEAAAALSAARRLGFDALLREQRRAWADRWWHADVRIGGDVELQLAVRFALFHLMASVADRGEAAVGARGLSGPAYAGHVFWDADVFVLPFLAATHPASARAMLEYRLRRLGAARHRARQAARKGAWFPWESAADGTDVTPRMTQSLDGTWIPVRTGEQEEHIVADVAWSACHYASWTGDATFLAGPGRALLLDTARYWASRVEVDADGSGHIRRVMGPDEYHEGVDDDAYTNVMARWNLRRAADIVFGDGRRRLSLSEAAVWRHLAEALVDGYHADSGLYEQFTGYWQLEPMLVRDVASPPVAADVLLGPKRAANSQVIKQADVLMLHHLVPHEVALGSLSANLAHYLPRTAHGSSLSPAIHAGLLARDGHPEQALELLRLAARLDLDDRTGTTAGGLHLGAMGGVWQALAFGWLGVRPHRTALCVDPRPLPSDWDHLEVRVRFQGHRVVLRLDHKSLDVDADGVVPLLVPGVRPLRTRAPARFRLRGEAWQEVRT